MSWQANNFKKNVVMLLRNFYKNSYYLVQPLMFKKNKALLGAITMAPDSFNQ